jgi:hypothetical protein
VCVKYSEIGISLMALEERERVKIFPPSENIEKTHECKV